MKFVPNAVSRGIAMQAFKAKSASPTLLLGVGVVGVVATAVLASRATLKLDQVATETDVQLHKAETLLNESGNHYTEKDYDHDVKVIRVSGLISVARLYAPAVTCGVITISSLVASNRILSKRNAALAAAYAGIEKAFREYRSRVAQQYGQDKEYEIRYGAETATVARDNEDGTVTKEKVTRAASVDASPYARFFDEFSTSWRRDPESNRFFIQCQQQWANTRLQARGYLFLNEVYESLGLEPTEAGQLVGWLYRGTGDGFVDFGLFNFENQASIDFVNGREGSVLLDFNVDGMIYDKFSR